MCFGLEMVTFFPNFGLEMDEKSGVLVWKWSRFSRILVCKWMKNRAFWFGKGCAFPNFGLEMDKKPGAFGLEMVTLFPIFGLEMDEKSGVFGLEMVVNMYLCI